MEMIIMAQFTTAEVAEKFETTPRTLRKFLRADARANDKADSLPGKGSRYMLEGKQLAPLKKRFSKWQAAEAEARAARAQKAADEAADAVEADTDETPEEPAETEPTDAELDAIDAD